MSLLKNKTDSIKIDHSIIQGAPGDHECSHEIHSLNVHENISQQILNCAQGDCDVHVKDNISQVNSSSLSFLLSIFSDTFSMIN